MVQNRKYLRDRLNFPQELRNRRAPHGPKGPAGALRSSGFGDRLGVGEDAQDVAAGQRREIGVRPAAIDQFGEQRRVAGDVLQPDRQLAVPS